MYNVEIKLLDKASAFMWPDERAAWQTLKAAVLAQQTTNSAMAEAPQCPVCLDTRKVGLFWTCERCGERWGVNNVNKEKK